MFNEIENLQYENKEIKFYTPTKKTAGRVSKIFRKEPITITWMSNIKENEIVIDIGANVGMYTLMSCIGRGAIVYGFEPEAANYNLLQQNIRLNNASEKIQSYCAGVLDYDGYSFLNIAKDGYVGPGGSGSTVEEKVIFDLSPMNVIFKQGINVIKLDTFCEKMKIKPDHIKIDVDGYEFKILRGALNTITKFKPIVYIELDAFTSNT